MSVIPPLEGADGSGSLIECIVFVVIGTVGNNTLIGFEDGVLSDTEAREIPVTWTGLNVVVVAEGSE